MNDASAGLSETLEALRAAAEETRLRMLALLAEGELSVSDLTDILGQSQPRISRHLKLLAEAGLVERHREGAWAFFRLGRARRPAQILRADARRPRRRRPPPRRRPGAPRRRAGAAARRRRRPTSRASPPNWDRMRSLHAAEDAVEAAMLDAVGREAVPAVCSTSAPAPAACCSCSRRARAAPSGSTASHAMLAVARANLEKAGLPRIELRQGDIYAPPFARDTFDLVVIHQVLHYLDDPARAMREAARSLAPGGRILIVDFAPHGLEFLREAQAHRRLGFAARADRGWLDEAGLDCTLTREIAPPNSRRRPAHRVALARPGPPRRHRLAAARSRTERSPDVSVRIPPEPARHSARSASPSSSSRRRPPRWRRRSGRRSSGWRR